MGIPTLPPRSNRSSRPPLTGAGKEAGIAAGGAPKPAPICGSESNRLPQNIQCHILQSDPNSEDYLQQDFLQGRRQAEQEKNKNLRLSVGAVWNYMMEGLKRVDGVLEGLRNVFLMPQWQLWGVYTTNKQNNKVIWTYIRECLLLCNWPFTVHTNPTI